MIMQKPAVQKKGKALQTRTDGSRQSCWAKRQLWRAGARWPWRTPLGRPVDPEV
jgi:hypothetical protein